MKDENININYDDWDDPDFYEDFWFGEDEENENWWEDDVCCYDPRYRGPAGSCPCKDYAEQEVIREAREKRWYNRIFTYNWSYRLYFLKIQIVDWLREKRILRQPSHFISCDHCGGRFDAFKHKFDCPGCGFHNLPF